MTAEAIPTLADRRRLARALADWPIYFLHVPKTAGSSFQKHLYEWFPERRQCHWGDWDTAFLEDEGRLGDYALFRGHFGAALEPHVGRPMLRVTFLRDPVARTVSHYHHVRRSPEHPYHRKAREQSLHAFVVDPENAHMIEDFQARSLVARRDSIPRLRAGLTRADLERFELQTRFECGALASPATLTEDAHAALARFVLVGVTEQFETSLACFCDVFERPSPKRTFRVNVGQREEAEPIDRETIEAIRTRTRIDRSLHEHAWRDLQRLVGEEKDHATAC